MKALGSYLGAVAQCHVDGSVITTAAAEVIGGSSNLPNDSSPMTPIGSAFVGWANDKTSGVGQKPDKRLYCSEVYYWFVGTGMW